MRNKLIILFFSSFLSSTITVNSQKLVNSPYSRFNLGTLEQSGSFRSQGMGGLGITLRDNSSVYFFNPASYSGFDTTSFVFDFGLDYGKNKLVEGSTKYSSDDMNFDHLIMGFPLARGWGFALGVVPMTNGYYKISEDVTSTDPLYDPGVGAYSSYHAGEGGLTNFFIGTGVNVTKNLSAGINMNLLFGSIKRTSQFDLADYYNSYNNNSTENLQIGGINLDYGLQYSLPLKDKHYLNLGVSLSGGKNYNTNYEHLIYVFSGYSTRDTMSYISEKSKSTYIPGSLRMGISYGKTNKFTAGFDFISTKWSASKIPGSVGYAADTKSYIFGAEFIPDKFSNYSFLKRVEYRIGAHTGDNYLIINGEQVKEIGASCGLGIPMRRSLSKTNIFFDYTRKSGAFSNGLHTENYYSIGISLNIYDQWFFKRKYD